MSVRRRSLGIYTLKVKCLNEIARNLEVTGTIPRLDDQLSTSGAVGPYRAL